jgi:hypothetical protein
MKFTLVLGMPRSGTSIVTCILEKMGLDLGIEEGNTLDGVYKVDHSVKQRRDIHLFSGLKCSNMEVYSESVPLEIFHNNKSRLIKEPYLLFLLNQIRVFVSNVVLVIRNPSEVVDSMNIFLKNN